MEENKIKNKKLEGGKSSAKEADEAHLFLLLLLHHNFDFFFLFCFFFFDFFLFYSLIAFCSLSAGPLLSIAEVAIEHSTRRKNSSEKEREMTMGIIVNRHKK